MGLFDFMKQKPPYEITGATYSCGNSLEPPSAYDDNIMIVAGARYLYVRVFVKVRRNCGVIWGVRFMGLLWKGVLPEDDAPAGYVMRFMKRLTAGDEYVDLPPMKIDFAEPGQLALLICDEDGATIGSRIIDVCLVGIQSVDFHGGPRGSRPDSFGMYVPKDAERLVPRMSLIVNKDIEFRFKVCIGFPKDKAAKDVDEYDIQYEYTASLRSSPGKVVHLLLPASDVHFNRKGPGVLHIFDMNGSCLAAGLFYVNE